MSHISGMIRAMSAVPRVHLADPQANVREIVEPVSYTHLRAHET